MSVEKHETLLKILTAHIEPYVLNAAFHPFQISRLFDILRCPMVLYYGTLLCTYVENSIITFVFQIFFIFQTACLFEMGVLGFHTGDSSAQGTSPVGAPYR